MGLPGVGLVRIAIVGLVVSVVLPGCTARAQQTGQGSSTGSSSSQGISASQQLPTSTKGPTQLPKLDGESPDPLITKLEEQQSKSRNADRQKKLQLDTEKLLSLATELKQQVDKTDKNILSVDVIKKADEIEKLAKSVKDRMKG